MIKIKQIEKGKLKELQTNRNPEEYKKKPTQLAAISSLSEGKSQKVWQNKLWNKKCSWMSKLEKSCQGVINNIIEVKV